MSLSKIMEKHGKVNTSFVCLDPKGELLRDTGNLLKAKGYDIKVIDNDRGQAAAV